MVRVGACPRPAQPRPHNTPAMVIRIRGPCLAIIHPLSGIAHVSSAMKSVHAHWISDSFQCVAAVSGPVKSAQPYCKFAIITMATTAALKRNQRFTIWSPYRVDGGRAHVEILSCTDWMLTPVQAVGEQ